MRRYLLEVIACSVEDARAAEAGGADRLELCSRLDLQGFTPPIEIAAAVAEAVAIPVRVMVRGNEGFQAGERELEAMERQIEAMAGLRIEGIVAGFHGPDGRLDFTSLDRLLRRAPRHWKLTLHRAFDFAAGTRAEKFDAVLKHGRADLILTAEPLAASPRIGFLLGGGVTAENALALLREHGCRQVHIGRAARWPEQATAPVSESRVRFFRGLLDRGPAAA